MPGTSRPSTHIDDEHRRRLLVHRHHLGPGGRVDRTVGEVAASLALLHSTDPATPHLSLQARTDASVAGIDAQFHVDRTLLRHTTIRRTVFAMPLDVVPFAHGAYNADLVARLRRQLVGWIAASDDVDEPADAFLDATERGVVEELRARGARTGGQLAEAVPALQVRFEPAPGKAYSTPMRITSKVLELLAAEGRIARGRPSGRSFTSGAWTWQLIEDWIGADGIEAVDPDAALDRLLERYLATFAPATVTDLAWWTGLGKGRVRSSVRRLGTVEVVLDGTDEPGLVLPGDDLEAPTLDGVVALLPGLDSTTMGWKQRAWYVDDSVDAGLFDRNGNAGPTVWLDGRVIGAWTQRPDGEVVTDLVATGPSGGELARAVANEAERLSDWLGDERVSWRYPTPRTKALSAA